MVNLFNILEQIKYPEIYLHFFLQFLRTKDTIFVILSSTKAKNYKYKHVKQNFSMYTMYLYKKLNQSLTAILFLQDSSQAINCLLLHLNQKYNCSESPAFKSRRVGYQSNQKTTASLSAFKKSPQFKNSFLKYSRSHGLMN